MTTSSSYDAVIAGGGHNGLVAACYLGLAGLRVLVLEKNDALGGATRSEKVFAGVDARLSVYSYLVSLLPARILADLGIRLGLLRRGVASYTPYLRSERRGGRHDGLLVSSVSEDATRRSFQRLPGGEREYRGYRKLQEVTALFADRVWPTLLDPLPSKQDLLKRFQTPEERRAWDYLVEKPLAALVEDHLAGDLVRGAVFTDAKIGVLTHPEDPSLLQNRTFIYHTIGQGTGEWLVPAGGMGALVDALVERAHSAGVELRTSAEVVGVSHGRPRSAVHFTHQGRTQAVEARWVLLNASSDAANRLLPGAFDEEQVEGSVFKINMVLKKLPALRDRPVSPREAFTGTLHINEGYGQMKESYRRAISSSPLDPASLNSRPLPGEVYCHSLTDPSILSPALREQGFQTLTLFGLDVPYGWFPPGDEAARAAVAGHYLRSLSALLDEDLSACLALDADGNPCVQAKSPRDLEDALGLPRGNIFHGSLTWPFAETAEEAGTWGVETRYENVLVCGSSARRGGAVSGIPGRNAAMKVLGRGL